MGSQSSHNLVRGLAVAVAVAVRGLGFELP